MSKKSVALALLCLALSFPATAARVRDAQPPDEAKARKVVQRAKEAVKKAIRAFENWPTLPKP